MPKAPTARTLFIERMKREGGCMALRFQQQDKRQKAQSNGAWQEGVVSVGRVGYFILYVVSLSWPVRLRVQVPRRFTNEGLATMRTCPRFSGHLSFTRETLVTSFIALATAGN